MMHFTRHFINQEKKKHQQVFRIQERCRNSNCSIENMWALTALVVSTSESQGDFFKSQIN